MIYLIIYIISIIISYLLIKFKVRSENTPIKWNEALLMLLMSIYFCWLIIPTIILTEITNNYKPPKYL